MSFLLNPDKREAAYLEIVEANANGTYSESGSKKFEVMFNPSEYSISYTNEISNEYSVILPANQSGQLYYMYSTPQLQTFKTSLFFDTFEQYSLNTGASVLNQMAVVNQFTNVLMQKSNLDVRTKIANIAEILNVSNASSTVKRVRFKWGSFSFVGAVKEAELSFVMFYANGTPARAKLDIVMVGMQESIKEYGTDKTAVYADSKLTALGKLAMVTAVTGLALARTAPKISQAVKNLNNLKEKENSKEKTEEKQNEIEEKKQKIDNKKQEDSKKAEDEKQKAKSRNGEGNTLDDDNKLSNESELAEGKKEPYGSTVSEEEKSPKHQEENTLGEKEDNASSSVPDEDKAVESDNITAEKEEKADEEKTPGAKDETLKEETPDKADEESTKANEPNAESGIPAEEDNDEKTGAAQSEPDQNEKDKEGGYEQPLNEEEKSSLPEDDIEQTQLPEDKVPDEKDWDYQSKDKEENISPNSIPKEGGEGEEGSHIENDSNVEGTSPSETAAEQMDTADSRLDEKPHFGKVLGETDDDFDTSDEPVFEDERQNENDINDAEAENESENENQQESQEAEVSGDTALRDDAAVQAEQSSSQAGGGQALEGSAEESGEEGQVENDPYALPR